MAGRFATSRPLSVVAQPHRHSHCVFTRRKVQRSWWNEEAGRMPSRCAAATWARPVWRVQDVLWCFGSFRHSLTAYL